MKHAKCELTEGSIKQDILATVVKREPGRPKIKCLERKRPVMPRQVSSEGKLAMLKAAAILQRGEDDYKFLYYYIIHLQLLTCINTHMAERVKRKRAVSIPNTSVQTIAAYQLLQVNLA